MVLGWATDAEHVDTPHKAKQRAPRRVAAPRVYQEKHLLRVTQITAVSTINDFRRSIISSAYANDALGHTPPCSCTSSHLTGGHKKGGDTPSAKRGQLPASAFDIASADDFPSLALGEVPRGPRGVSISITIFTALSWGVTKSCTF